jgi:hypothetical protein
MGYLDQVIDVQIKIAFTALYTQSALIDLYFYPVGYLYRAICYS